MNILLIILSTIFIWNELYYIKNKLRLDINFRKKDIKSTTMKDVLFYITRFFYWLFTLIFLFVGSGSLFIVLFAFKLIQIPLYHLNRKWFIYYENFLPIMCSIVLFLIALTQVIN